ncbi:MAG: hypothetical protein CISAcid_00250 [uncultured Acidilobus sp. CIS]|jgi:hypothetical protein|nr:MAG: hypothetical protein CISAcid_00250 [uncultured Acidilobus sp. CIS]
MTLSLSLWSGKSWAAVIMFGKMNP